MCYKVVAPREEGRQTKEAGTGLLRVVLVTFGKWKSLRYVRRKWKKYSVAEEATQQVGL